MAYKQPERMPYKGSINGGLSSALIFPLHWKTKEYNILGHFLKKDGEWWYLQTKFHSFCLSINF